MITLVTARLRKRDVILYRDNLDIPLLTNHVRNLVNIGGKGTDNADTRYIIDVLYHIVNGRFVAVPLELFHNTFRRFHSGFNMFNGIIPMYMLKLVI